jgi:hypothetical protein
MDEIIGRIKEYALVFKPSLTDDDLLDLIVEELADRVLAYTNREQLIRDYEEDVVDYPITDKTDTTETYYNFWKNYGGYPIPPVLEKPLARTVVQVASTVEDDLEGKEIKSISDQGQSITFSDEVQSYLSSTSDTEIFMSIKSMLDKFRIPTVVRTTDEYTRWVY